MNQAELPPTSPPLDQLVPPARALSRLHSSTLWLPLFETILTLIIPMVVMSFIMNAERAIYIFSVFVVIPSAGFNILRYLTTRFRLNNRELIIRSGILFRKERRIPFERIQDLELHQTLVRRWLGLASLKVTTAGAEAEEAALDVVTANDAEQMRQEIAHFQSSKNEGEPTEDSESIQSAEQLSQLGWRELALGGLTSNLVAALGAIVGAFLYLNYFQSWDIGKLDGLFEKTVQRQLDRIETTFFFGKLVIQAVNFFFFSGSFGKALLFAIVGTCGSIATFAIRYHGFRLTLLKGVTTRTYGLFSIRRTSLPLNRIQAIKIDEGLLRRLFGLAAIRADSAGDRKEVNENQKRDLLVPVATRGNAEAITLRLLPDLNGEEREWKKVSKQAIMRRSRLGWSLCLYGMLQTSVWVGWFAMGWLVACPLVYFLNLQWYRNTKYCVTDHYVIWRTGWINRTTLFLPIRNIQNVALSQSPFDRRLSLASVSIDTAGQSNTGGGPVIRHLPIEAASELQKLLIHRVVQTKFQW
jgi:putative membrane protein